MSRRPRVKVAVNLTSKRSKKNDIKNSDDLENIKEENSTFQEGNNFKTSHVQNINLY